MRVERLVSKSAAPILTRDHRDILETAEDKLRKSSTGKSGVSEALCVLQHLRRMIKAGAIIVQRPFDEKEVYGHIQLACNNIAGKPGFSETSARRAMMKIDEIFGHRKV